MANSCKNYKTDAGNTTVIEGKLEIKSGATITGLDASASAKGLVKQGVAVDDAAGDAPTAAEFKALLDSLRAAGIIATADAE